MKDSIVISASCADAAFPEPLRSDGQKADAAFGSFLVHYLDHSEYEAHAAIDRSRHTRVSHRLSRMVARLCARSGLSAEALAGPRTGLVSGSSYGCSPVYEMHHRLRQQGPRGVDAVRFAQATHNYPVSSCAIEYGLQGPCLSVVSTETAGLDALQCAFDWLRDNRCDRVLVTAFEDFAPPTADHLLARARATPGTAFGEAMVLLLLERETAATARGLAGLARLGSVTNIPARGRSHLHIQCSDPAVRTMRSQALDFLGAGGLLAIHDLLTSPDGAGPAATDWQIAVTAPASGIAVNIALPQMEHSQ
ncbi:hypothetical protein GEU84_013675 [Fertoebacter nigrum]|uniref:Beta-ketoacyl synthase-like N-terminal domain-containing protein n=1 Tax=Fertoeibacter niger TaxID=2656921 RepID=A0A8X8H4G4_9RHOB|nr:beta-ketoacyl synthase N-terminal-like domain-containing protein [Fertoeibacter niger]NUB45443.1 hypothetical protein [Fertoeibacter niger]